MKVMHGRSLRRQEALDRRAAAIHEAGHMVIADHLGRHSVSGWIARAGTPTFYSRSWVGRTKFWGNARGRKFIPPSKKESLMIGIAGMVANETWRNGGNGCTYTMLDDLLWDPNCMSQTDWALPGLSPEKGPNKRQVMIIEEVCLLVAGPLWLAVLAQARALIVAARCDIESESL